MTIETVPIRNLVNVKSGKLTIRQQTDDYVSDNGKRRVQWLADCTCGETRVVSASQIRGTRAVTACRECSVRRSQDRVSGTGTFLSPNMGWGLAVK